MIGLIRTAWNKKNQISGFTLVCIEIFVLGCILRAYHFAQFPIFGETRDEIAWTMLGASWLQTGEPQSWSYFPPYKDFRDVWLHDTEYRLVKPAVDHPPLFSFIPGSMSTLRGTAWDTLPSVKAIRAPMILLSFVNLGLFLVVAWKWLGRSVAAVAAMLLFAAVPSWVLLQRLVVSENLMLTWILLLLLAFAWSEKRWATFLGGVSLWALPLTKFSGAAVVVATLVSQGKTNWRARGRWWWAAAVLGVASVLAYFWLVDWRLFIEVQSVQAGRDTGFLTLFSTQIWAPTLIRHHFGDPWIILGLVSTAFCVTVGSAKTIGFRVNEQAWTVFRALFLAQMAFILMSVGEQTTHGWYRIVLFPFFALSLGACAGVLWRSRSLWGLSILWIVMSLSIRQALWFTMGPALYEWQSALSKMWLAGAGGLVSAEIWLTPARKRWIFTFGSLLLIGIVLLSSISTFWNISNELYWKDGQYIERGEKG